MGVLAQQAGIPAWLTGLMSIFLFAGSAQFIGVAMIDAGASMAAIVVTTFMVNLRHALMGSALAVYLRGSIAGFSPCSPTVSRMRPLPLTWPAFAAATGTDGVP